MSEIESHKNILLFKSQKILQHRHVEKFQRQFWKDLKKLEGGL